MNPCLKCHLLMTVVMRDFNLFTPALHLDLQSSSSYNITIHYIPNSIDVGSQVRRHHVQIHTPRNVCCCPSRCNGPLTRAQIAESDAVIPGGKEKQNVIIYISKKHFNSVATLFLRVPESQHFCTDSKISMYSNNVIPTIQCGYSVLGVLLLL